MVFRPTFRQGGPPQLSLIHICNAGALENIEPMQSMGGKQVTRTIAIIQLIVTLLVAAGSLMSDGVQAARSALVGGGVSMLVSFYFARQVFSVRIGSPAAKIARAFYVGELEMCIRDRFQAMRTDGQRNGDA